ncbi:MAG: N-acetylglucosamine-6-phosphate deacetylase [Blastocatellia bacterium]
MSDRLAITGGTVVLPDKTIERGLVLCEDGKITYAGPARAAAPEPGARILDASGLTVMPGFVDTHVHGSGGDDVMMSGAAGINRAARAMLRYGTTAWLPTTIADNHRALLRVIEHTQAAESLAQNSAEPSADILGMHIEGPYINPKYKGAQPEEGIRDPDLDECGELIRAAGGRIRIMTLAPELPGAIELIGLLTKHGVTASLGHSEADYDTALAGIAAGATRATHLYNAMSGLHHRKPGLAAACLHEPGITAELILDGVHVHPQMARLAFRAKGRDGIVLVTDAAAAQGCPDGTYTLGEHHQIQVRGNLCTLMDGVTIAGSVLTMNRAVMNAAGFMGMSLVEAAYTAALAPARFCGAADRKGSIETGKDADLAILHPDFNVAATVKSGVIAWRAHFHN